MSIISENKQPIPNRQTQSVPSESQPVFPRRTDKNREYWNSSITSGSDGIAAISFTMPNKKAKWRLILTGSDGKSQFIDFRLPISTIEESGDSTRSEKRHWYTTLFNFILNRNHN